MEAVVVKLIRNTAFAAAAALACATASNAGNAPVHTSQMTTDIELPNSGFPNGNMVADNQGGYFIPWVDISNGLEIINVRPGQSSWSIVGTTQPLNGTNGSSITYLAPDGSGGVVYASCTKAQGQSDVIGTATYVGGTLTGTVLKNETDLSNGSTRVCRYNGLAAVSPSLFFVSNSYTLNGTNSNGVQQVAVNAGQGTFTSFGLDGGSNLDHTLIANSKTQLVGINDSGTKGTGEIFQLTLKHGTAAYKRLYALKAKLGTKFYSLASTGGGQYVGSALAQSGDGLTLNIVENAKSKLVAQKIAANTGAYEIVSKAPTNALFWEVAPPDVIGNSFTARSYNVSGRKYVEQSQAVVPSPYYPLDIKAKDDGSADGLITDLNDGTNYVVTFSSGMRARKQPAILAHG